jgi:dolichol-phosphate mannosyltransferase
LSASTSSGQDIEYSVVIPFYNEETNVGPVLTELRSVLDHDPRAYEVVLVNDGSTDKTLDQMKGVVSTWPAARIVNLLQNAGQGAALFAGIKRTLGKNVILLDGDGQNDPGDIPEALRLLDRYDFVVGHRVHRHDDLKRRLMSQFANYVRRLFTDDGVSDTGCGLKGFHREVIDAFIPMQTLYSFMPALAKAAGFSIAEFPVNHRPRRSGIAKYNLRVFLWRPAVDLLGVCWFSRRRSRRVAAEELAADREWREVISKQ